VRQRVRGRVKEGGEGYIYIYIYREREREGVRAAVMDSREVRSKIAHGTVGWIAKC
jgi:hypothetical protein